MFAPSASYAKQYTNQRYPLSLPANYSQNNLHLIAACGNAHGALMIYIMCRMTARRDSVLDAMTVTIAADWNTGIRKADALTALNECIMRGVLVKVNESKRCRLYYVNPHVVHVLTSMQRSLYMINHQDLFPELML